MEEYPIALTYRPSEMRGHWIMILANAYKIPEHDNIIQNKIVSEGTSAIGLLLGCSCNIKWKFIIVFSIYIGTIASILMITDTSIMALVVIQHVCTFFFIIDFSLAILHRIWYHSIKVSDCRRKLTWLIIEAISMIPLSTVYLIVSSEIDNIIVFYLSIVQFLRLYKIPQFFYDESNSAGVPHLKYKLLEFFLYVILCIIIFSVAWVKIDAPNQVIPISNWNATELNKYITGAYFAIMTLSSTGFGDISAISVLQEICCCMGMLVGFTLTAGLFVGAMAWEFEHKEKARENYRNVYETLIKKLKRVRAVGEINTKLLNDLKILWEYKKGITNHETFNLFPVPLRKEIFFDIAFGLLSRSQLFSVQERSFLRSISLAMKNKTYLPGDDIVRHGGILNGMLCVTAGVIEILSRENDDTPIISFTSGTILGEVSLFMAIPITTIIRAATIVELQILYTIDFYHLALKYHENYLSMRKIILTRVKESLRTEIPLKVNQPGIENLTTARLNVLKSLIEDLQLEDLDDEEPSTSINSFKTNILNLYIFIENIPRVKTLPIDLLKKKPWILRPDTTFTLFWNTFMFIAVTTVLFIYPYLAAFVRKIDDTTNFYLVLIEIIYVIDLLLQCVIAVPRGDLISYYTSIRDILSYKFSTYGFYLDILSAYEFGILNSLFSFGTLDHMRLLLSLNKLLRIWMIPRYFRELEDKLSYNILIIRLLKFVYFTMWIIHFAAAVFYLEACPGRGCYSDSWFIKFQLKEVREGVSTPYTEHPYTVSLYLGLMCTTAAGFGNVSPGNLYDSVTVIVFIVSGLAIFSYCLANLSAVFKHRGRRRAEFQQEIFAIDRFLREHQLPQDVRQRVKRYFQVQWDYNKGAAIKIDIPVAEFPMKVKDMIFIDKIQTLKSVPIFKDANPGFMKVLAKGCRVLILPVDETVVYAGSFDKEMYILQSGYCKIVDKRISTEYGIIGPYTSFGELEMIQGLPMSISVITVTHARIICIEYSLYQRAVTKYPDTGRQIVSLIETQDPGVSSVLYSVPYDPSQEQNKVEKGWKKFSSSIKASVVNVYKYDKNHGRKYWSSFHSWNKFHFLKYLFMPFVIKPNTPLMHALMVLRIIVALLVCLFAPIYFSISSRNHFIEEIIKCVQVILWIDFYISFHIAYYDKRGILTFHPSKTVIYYLTHNFAVDLVLVFPFFWVARPFTGGQNVSYNTLGLVKVGQFCKIVQALNHYEKDILRETTLIKLLKLVPLLLIFTNLATGLLLLTECRNFNPDEKVPQGDSLMSIYRNSVLENCKGIKMYKRFESVGHFDFDMYLIAYYWLTAAMTTCGLGDIVAHDHTTLIYVICTVYLGTLLYGCIFGSITSSRIFEHKEIIEYRMKIKEMMTFLDKETKDEETKMRLFKHYEYNWMRTLGHNPQETLSQIHTALKKDIVHNMYEGTLRKISFLDKSFIRCIGKYIEEIYFLKGETIVKHNHIHNEIYIIYRGKVDIFGAGNKVITTMGDGGLFGNIRKKPFSLSSITAIASTKVELLRLGSNNFRKELQHFPSIDKKIKSLTAENQDYILPTTDEARVGNFQGTTIFSTISISTISERFYLRNAVYKYPDGSEFGIIFLSDSWLYKTIEIVTVIFSYLSVLMIMYVFAFQDFRIPVFIPYMGLDVFFYLKFLMEFQYTYINKDGDHIYHRRAIAKRYMSSTRFYVDVFANFPFELFAVAAPESMQYTALSFLRLNRLLRLFYVFEYHSRKINTLMVNIIILETLMVSVYCSLIIHLFACAWYLTACPIWTCTENSWLVGKSLQNAGKVEIYITSLYFVMNLVTTTGYGDITPINIAEVFVATLMMIISHFIMVLGAVGFVSILSAQTIGFINYEESMLQLRRDLIRQHFNTYQLKKIWKYMQLLWLRENGKQLPYFIHTAPYILKCDIYNAMYGKHFEQSIIFQDLNPTFLRQLAIYMERYVFFPGNYIVQQGDNDGTMYFIHRGEVSVMTIHLNLVETIHCNIRGNDQFGIEQGLVFGLPHQFSYRAQTEVEVLSLTLEHWQHLFKYYPEIKPIIYERLNLIK